MCTHCEADVRHAYFAGLIDGEGYLGIRTVRKSGGDWTSYAIQLSIGNTVPDPLHEGQRLWGGAVYVEVNPKRRRPMYRWSLTSQRAAALLVDVYPYLRIKQAQAEVLLRLQERVDAIKDRLARSPEEQHARYLLQQEARALNGKLYNGEYVAAKLKVISGGCTHCGCGEPSNRHGNKDSITVGDVNRAMKVGVHDKGVSATAGEMNRMVRRHARRRK